MDPVPDPRLVRPRPALSRPGHFYIVDDRPEVYTAEGLAWVEANTMKSVLLRHYPELGAAGLDLVDNAFTPWNTDWSVTGC